MRRPLLAIYQQNYRRHPYSYLEELYADAAWSAERLAPLVGEERADLVARELRIPKLWLYLDSDLYHWYESVDEAREDMEVLAERGDRRVQHLRARPPPETLAGDFLHFLLQFTAGLA